MVIDVAVFTPSAPVWHIQGHSLHIHHGRRHCALVRSNSSDLPQRNTKGDGRHDDAAQGWRTITRKHTSAASGAKIQSHNAMQCWSLCSASVRTQPRKDNKETTIKMVFSFPPEERVPFSQPRKDDGARRCGEGTFSVPQHACDGKTQQSKVCCHGSFFIPSTGPISGSHKQEK